MMVGFVPLATIVAQRVLLAKPPSRRELFGVMGGLLCLAVLFADGLQRAIPLNDMLLAMSVPCSYAVSNTYIRRRFPELDPIILTSVTLVMAAILMLPAFAFEPLPILSPETLGANEQPTIATLLSSEFVTRITYFRAVGDGHRSGRVLSFDSNQRPALCRYGGIHHPRRRGLYRLVSG